MGTSNSNRTEPMQQRLAHIRARMASVDGKQDLLLVAASKSQPPENMRALAQTGHRHFGENYVAEALTKMEKLADLDLCWHMIGFVQNNKARQVAEHFDWVHTLGSLTLAQRLSRYRPQSHVPLKVMIQVNLDGERQKNGVAADEVVELAEHVAALPALVLCGLMAIPKPQQSHEASLASLRRLALLRDTVWPTLRQQHPNVHPKGLLSMGMSADLEAAVEAGSDILRVGTDLMGSRAPKSAPTTETTPSTLTHLDEKGRMKMVDVSAKASTVREAWASGHIVMKAQTLRLVQHGSSHKGHVLEAARLAGIMAAKKTADLIPLCHPLMLEQVKLDFHYEANGIRCESYTKLSGKTGVEMEALVAVQVALLTIYDMCKSVDREMHIEQVRLLRKQGGRSGLYWSETTDEA